MLTNVPKAPRSIQVLRIPLRCSSNACGRPSVHTLLENAQALYLLCVNQFAHNIQKRLQQLKNVMHLITHHTLEVDPKVFNDQDVERQNVATQTIDQAT